MDSTGKYIWLAQACSVEEMQKTNYLGTDTFLGQYIGGLKNDRTWEMQPEPPTRELRLLDLILVFCENCNRIKL